MASPFYLAYETFTNYYIDALSDGDLRTATEKREQIDKLNDYINRYSMACIDNDVEKRQYDASQIRLILELDDDIEILYWGLGSGTSGSGTDLNDYILHFDSDISAYTAYASRTAAGSRGAFYSGTDNPINNTYLDTNALVYNGAFKVAGYGSDGFTSLSYSGDAIYAVSVIGDAVTGESNTGTAGIFESNMGSSLNVLSNGTLTGNKTANFINIVREETGSSYDITGHIFNINDSPVTSGNITGSLIYYTLDGTLRLSFNPRILGDVTGSAAYILDTLNTLDETDRLRILNHGNNPFIIESDGSVNIPLGAYFKIDSNAITTANISEETNLYFTEDRVLDTVLVGLESTTGSVIETDTILQAFGKLAYDQHPELTLRVGLANGLILYADQQLGMDVASSTSTGSLTDTDWNTFNDKQDDLGYTPENLAHKGIANGYVPLGSDLKIDPVYIGSLTLTNPPFVVDTIPEMLLLDAEVGDACIVGVGATTGESVTGSTYMLQALPSTDIDNWVMLLFPVSVISVNGLTGIVNITTTNLGAVPITRAINGYALSSDVNLTNTDIGSEPNLGNPPDLGYTITSTIDGVRSWILMPTGGGDSYMFQSGITEVGGIVTLGGEILQNVDITGDHQFNINIVDMISLRSYDADTGAYASVWINYNGEETVSLIAGAEATGGSQMVTLDRHNAKYASEPETGDLTDLTLMHKKYIDDLVSGVSSYTFGNGITESDGIVSLEGILTKNTNILGDFLFSLAVKSSHTQASDSIDWLVESNSDESISVQAQILFGTTYIVSITSGGINQNYSFTNNTIELGNDFDAENLTDLSLVPAGWVRDQIAAGDLIITKTLYSNTLNQQVIIRDNGFHYIKIECTFIRTTTMVVVKNDIIELTYNGTTLSEASEGISEPFGGVGIVLSSSAIVTSNLVLRFSVDATGGDVQMRYKYTSY